MTTRRQELQQLDAVLQALAAHEHSWAVIDPYRERPDFDVDTPWGRKGLELTELLIDRQGEHREAERRLVSCLSDVVSDVLRSEGGTGGGHIAGNVGGLESGPHGLRLGETADGFRRHLSVYGSALARDRGVMREPFYHEAGSVSDVERVDSRGGVMPIYDGLADGPDYKRPVDIADIEHAAASSVTKKAKLAEKYDEDWPLWLALRNPNQRLAGVSAKCIDDVTRANDGRFERILVYNDPEDVSDPRPPGPLVLDLIPWPPERVYARRRRGPFP